MYQFQFAPVPNEPPLTLSVVDEPTHIGFGVAVALDGATEAVLTVTGKQVEPLVPHKLLAVTHTFPALPGVALTDVVP